jgi:Protein of unknown function (DUF3788)
MTVTESPLNLVRGPAKKPGWAQLVRLGGDRVAILFDELRKSVGRIDGVVERLHYSQPEGRWLVQYQAGGVELFTVRISPGLLEAGILLGPSEIETILKLRGLSGTIKNEIRAAAGHPESCSFRFALRDRRTVRSFANLARMKDKLVRKSGRRHS